MLRLLSFLFLLINLISYSQESIVIKGKLEGNDTFKKVIVQKFGVGVVPIAMTTIKDGFFEINAPKNTLPGVYRLQYNDNDINDYLDIIIDGKEEEISFVIDCKTQNRVVTFLSSEENKFWYNYLEKSKLQLEKIEVLQQFVYSYPTHSDKIFQETLKAIKKERVVLDSFFRDFVKQRDGTWSGLMVSNRPYFFSNPLLAYQLQADYVHKNYWNNINTTNTKLINTPLYTELILNYLKYYSNSDLGLSTEAVEEGLKSSVDTIMMKFSGNEETRNFALKYLQLGFKEIGNEKILQYIDQKYKDLLLQCQDDNGKSSLEERLKGYETLKPGNMAPEVLLTKVDLTTFGLKDIEQEQIVLIFWASWCPNCEEQMPLLQKLAKNNKNVAFLAISLDDDRASYSEKIKEYPDIFHYCDFKKWNGKIVNDYFIYGTPTFILIDQEKRIVNKFTNVNELFASINKSDN